MEHLFKDKTDMPLKAVAIFDAFLKLRDNGADLLRIKVSDIAKEAGIGKGTLYEYFSSKEEIIIKASVYEYCMELTRLEERMRKEESFEHKLDSALEWMSMNVRKSFLLMQFMKQEDKFNEAGRAFCQELVGKEACELVDTAIENLLSCGVKEKIIRQPSNKLEQEMILAGAGAAFMNYLAHADRYGEHSYDEAKNYAKQILLTSLRL